MELLQLIQAVNNLDTVQRLVIWVLPVIFAITVHEAAHGYAAKHFGDTTAYQLGRISLNPARHIDLVGTILIPGLTLLIGGMMFGWAKPVPVNFGRLHKPKQDMLWVAAAGPGANLAMAILWALAIKLSPMLPEAISLPLALMGAAGVFMNVIIMVLNLFPIPPLDGGRMAISLLPNRLAWRFSKIEPYGLIILLVLLFSHTLDRILWPVIKLMLALIASIIL